MKEVITRKSKMFVLVMMLLVAVIQLSATDVSTDQSTCKVKKVIVLNNANVEDVQFTRVETTIDSLEDGKTKKIIINMNTNDAEEGDENSEAKAFMGVYTEDLSVKKIRELDYNNNYGVLITGVTSNSPAGKQGIAKNDIMMKFDDTELTDKDTFESVITRYHAGDKIQLTYFRDGKEATKEFVFGRRSLNVKVNIGQDQTDMDFDEDSDEDVINIKTKKGNSVGYGGGTWMPIWVALDMEDVNGLISSVGFSELNKDGLLFNGGGGKITIGKGLFLGGMGAGYSVTKKKNAIVGEGDDAENVIRRLSYNTSFGGVTLDKRFAITKNFIGSIGLMIGGAGQTIEISQTKGDYDWEAFDSQIQDSVNNYVKFERKYIIAQPKVELLYRLTSWLGFRAEGGYIASYGWNSGWNCNVTGDTFEVSNSPDTKFDTYTISVGPWFGF